MDKLTRKTRSSFLPKISGKFLKIIPKFEWKGSNANDDHRNAVGPLDPAPGQFPEKNPDPRASPALNPNPPPQQTRSTARPGAFSPPQSTRPPPNQHARPTPQAQPNNVASQNAHRQQRPVREGTLPGAPRPSPGNQSSSSNPFGQPNGTLHHSRRRVQLLSLALQVGLLHSVICRKEETEM